MYVGAEKKDVLELRNGFMFNPDAIKAGKKAVKEGEALVDSLECMKIGTGNRSELIVNARISETAGTKATVVAAVSKSGAATRYVQLLDSGKGTDRKEGDRIFSGKIRLGKTEEPVEVRVGGIGESGEVLVEKKMTFNLSETN